MSPRIDVDFIAELEGNKSRAYVPDVGNSGVTIGMGLDLSAFGDLSVLDISEKLLNKLLPYQGYRRDIAKAFLEDNPLKLSDDELGELNYALIAYKEERIAALYNRDSAYNWDNDLDYKMRTVVFSVLHQYGSPRRVPKFWRAATNGKWQDVIDELRDFGDAFPTRRRKEANYLQESLNV